MTMGAPAPKAQKRQYPSLLVNNNNHRAALRASRAESLVGRYLVIMGRGGTSIFGRHFYLIVSSGGGTF